MLNSLSGFNGVNLSGLSGLSATLTADKFGLSGPSEGGALIIHSLKFSNEELFKIRKAISRSQYF
jgi:hypothetical protein